jgi:hypothetical protein
MSVLKGVGVLTVVVGCSVAAASSCWDLRTDSCCVTSWTTCSTPDEFGLVSEWQCEQTSNAVGFTIMYKVSPGTQFTNGSAFAYVNVGSCDWTRRVCGSKGGECIKLPTVTLTCSSVPSNHGQPSCPPAP